MNRTVWRTVRWIEMELIAILPIKWCIFRVWREYAMINRLMWLIKTIKIISDGWLKRYFQENDDCLQSHQPGATNEHVGNCMRIPTGDDVMKMETRMCWWHQLECLQLHAWLLTRNSHRQWDCLFGVHFIWLASVLDTIKAVQRGSRLQ